MDYQLDLHGEMLMEQYHERQAVYQRLAQVAEATLREALKAQHVAVIALEHRVKTETSLAGKLELKGAKYHTLDDVTDIVGMRVVTFYSDDVDKVAAIVNEVFEVDWNNSVDKRKLHRLDSFGYNSLHYICRLKAPAAPPTAPEGKAPPTAPEGASIVLEAKETNVAPSGAEGGAEGGTLYSLRFEIQMRTALQHVWSTLDHDTAYKGNVKIPREYKRQFNRLAGMLELIDEEFSRLRNTLTDYSRQMLALEASGRLDEVDLNVDTFRRYLEAQPFARLNHRIAAINQAELYPVPMMPFLRVLQKMGFETLGDVNRLIEEYSDDAYRLAVSQLGKTDLDILSENIGLQNLCFVYVLKRGGGPAELCEIYDWLNGYDSGNKELAKKLFEQARTLKFEH
jgi:ppGpp synthetase/RelA/SpoT-type nucleotidyltranferase